MATTRSRPAAWVATRTLTPGDMAWLAAPLVAALTLAAVVLLGPALGRAAFGPSGQHILSDQAPNFRPEPTEHARFVIALLGPLLLSAAVLLGVRAGAMRRRGWILGMGVRASQLLAIAALVAVVIVQDRTKFAEPYYGDSPYGQHVVYFTLRALAVAAGLLLLGLMARVVVVLVARARERNLGEETRPVPSPRRERRWWTITALLLGLAYLVAWELTAFNTDSTIVAAGGAVSLNFEYWLDETFAVLNGQPPLVSTNAQYGQLWPYLAAAVLGLTRTTLAAYCAVMVTGTCAMLTAVYALLRRVTRSSLMALGLYVPFVATSFFMERGPLEVRYGPANLFSLFPIRYGGPYVLAWLISRHLDGVRPRGRVLLFAVAGAVAVNNVEFGIPAFGAALAALLWTSPRLDVGVLARLGRDALLGLLAALAAISLLTLGVAGALPHFSMIFTFIRRYASDGFGLLPMKPVGMQLALYATFASAIVTATVRAVRGEERVLTGLLAFAGVFGLGAGSYFVGRSHPEVLIDIFSIWALTLGLLTVHVVGSMRARHARIPSPPELAVLFGFAITLCSLAQTPTPWSQIERLRVPSKQRIAHPTSEEHDIARVTRRGEHVAIISALGHRMGYELGISDVMPYSDPLILYREQVDEILHALRASGGHKVFISNPYANPQLQRVLRRRGFHRMPVTMRSGMVALTSER